MTTRFPPKRQNSTVSSASSGGRTIRANSTPGRRRSSAASTNPPPAGLFARLTGKSRPRDDRGSSESDDEDEKETIADTTARKAGDDLGEDDLGEDEAGPSDYWRKTPSPPPNWRTASSEPWPDDLSEGNYDVWRNEDHAQNGVAHAAEDEDEAIDVAGDAGGAMEVGTPDVDAREYEMRMRSIMQDASAASPASSTVERQRRRMKNGQKGQQSLGAGYDAAYRDVMDKDPEVASARDGGEEEFGTFDFPQRDDRSDATPTSSVSAANGGPPPFKRNVTPYLHPSVSRLRSHLRTTSSSTTNSLTGQRPGHARIPSHFSQMSLARSESTSNLSIAPPAITPSPDSTPAFDFHPLRHLSAHLFGRRGSGRSSPIRPPASRKTSILGSTSGQPADDLVLGRPSVIDVKGMIAVGTDSGYVVVYGFGQDIRAILGPEAIVKTAGPVTAVTISPDQTYIAVGHAGGNIYLYDLSTPIKPARSAIALTLKQVLSGRKEGHLQNSRIIHIGFVGARHTSIVSGDEHGRAFWWSLGKVMGVESTDVVRMLGSYPEFESSIATAGHPSKRPTTLFAASPLPLGSAAHASDTFHLSVLVTPVKLVVVGMKPTAKTWYRKMRDDLGGQAGATMGCTAWLKSGELEEGSDPVLVYSWGSHLRFLRVGVITEEGEGKPQELPKFTEGRRFDAPNPITALEWFDKNHLLVVTTAEIILLDVRTVQAVETTPLQTKLLASNNFYAGLESKDPSTPVEPCVASSVRIHREKLFLLTKSNVQVGTLQHWNDRILNRVHAGDFLGAISVALSYYDRKASSNYIGLPDDDATRREVVGKRTRELMRASLEWAFSEDRMRDDTHYTPDGRGVDLTTLFEGLATCCIEACLAMDDMTFLFDDSYESYANVGIQGIFLAILEPYIFDHRIRDVPPNIIQALIRLHEEKHELDLAEAVIWHVEPIALDINQVVTLCEAHGLVDALIHVYTRAMKDFVAPLVKLMELVQEVYDQRQHRVGAEGEVATEEKLVPEAYKLFAYVEAILTGISYPSNEGLPEYDADLARAEVYAFLFSDRLAFWPEGPDGRLVLPGRGDRSYPYLDLLLQFDPEAFLHSMDIAFEDSYLNDPKAAFSRQTIINIMLDHMRSSPVFRHGDLTLLHIFVCRNIPKYPQFLFIPPTMLQHILVSLTEDEDQSTREDRQLAAEYLLSAYTPQDGDEMLRAFRQAGFWRILRTAYRRDRRWEELIGAYVQDPDIDLEVFSHLDDLARSTRIKKDLDPALVAGFSSAIPDLLDLSTRQTALLLDSYPDLAKLHSQALQLLRQIGNDHRTMAYLRCLLQPELDDEDVAFASRAISSSLSTDARHDYVDLLVAHESSSVLSFLDSVGATFFDLPRLLEQFKQRQNHSGQLWTLDAMGQTTAALDVVGEVLRDQTTDLASALAQHQDGDVHMALQSVDEVVKMAIRLCKEHSTKKTDGVEDMWYGVLHELLEVNHDLSAVSGLATSTATKEHVEEHIRGLVGDTLSALVSSSSSQLSFPRLFKRLVDSTDGGKSSTKQTKGRAYAQFRSILSGMLDSYKAESEGLIMTTRLVNLDLFENVKQLKEKRDSGWRPGVTLVCDDCGKFVGESDQDRGMRVMGDGRVVHPACAGETEEQA